LTLLPSFITVEELSSRKKNRSNLCSKEYLMREFDFLRKNVCQAQQRSSRKNLKRLSPQSSGCHGSDPTCPETHGANPMDHRHWTAEEDDGDREESTEEIFRQIWAIPVEKPRVPQPKGNGGSLFWIRRDLHDGVKNQVGGRLPGE
jgi:hypothetical protein